MNTYHKDIHKLTRLTLILTTTFLLMLSSLQTGTRVVTFRAGKLIKNNKILMGHMALR